MLRHLGRLYRHPFQSWTKTSEDTGKAIPSPLLIQTNDDAIFRTKALQRLSQAQIFRRIGEAELFRCVPSFPSPAKIVCKTDGNLRRNQYDRSRVNMGESG